MPRHHPSVHRRARAAVALVVILGLAVVTAGCGPRPTLHALDQRVYGTSLPAFASWWQHEHAAAQRVSPSTVAVWLDRSPGRLGSAAARRGTWDLTTDLCSSAPDRGPSFDFRLACIRHDFAWRNLRRLDRLAGGGIDTHARRVAATNQFLRDMQATCVPKGIVVRSACRLVAAAYHRAVLAVS